ncbi:MAG TPA: enoyl-CoA hydratase-related protein, partial [Pseudomonadota bacterium]|nr:enoyl-CoA hydratase-related protein [Pseudomonadota bacterium]
MNPTFQTLLYEIDGPLLTLTVNRPKVLNALNEQVLDELYEALQHAGEQPELRAIILTG